LKQFFLGEGYMTLKACHYLSSPTTTTTTVTTHWQ